MAAIQALGAERTAASARGGSGRVAQRTLRQYTRFLVVGVSNALVDLGLLNLLASLVPPHDALVFAGENSMAVACALLNSYMWNARWTFRGQGTGTPRERALFFAQALLNLLLNNVVLLTVVVVVAAVLLATLASWAWAAVLVAGWVLGLAQARLSRRRS